MAIAPRHRYRRDDAGTLVRVLLAAVLAVLAAASNALASVGQRAAARQAPQHVSFRLSLLRELARRPVWWAGIAGVVGGAVFQGSALIFGPLALVQPILMVELPFTLMFAAAVFGRPLDRRSTAAMLGLTAGIVLLLVAVAPSGGVTTVEPVRWLVCLPATAAAVAALALAGRSLRRAAGATLLGASAAVSFALTAALMKDATDRIPRGAAAFFGTWQLYLTAAVGLVALFLLQNAYQAGPLAASQPALTLGDALVSLVYSVVLFDERLRSGWWLLPAAAGALLILAGALGLARSPLVAATTGHAEPDHGEPDHAETDHGEPGHDGTDHGETDHGGTAHGGAGRGGRGDGDPDQAEPGGRPATRPQWTERLSGRRGGGTAR